MGARISVSSVIIGIGFMIEQNTDLGKLVAVHGPAPALTQRAIFLAIISFVFFLLMMIAFSIRQQIGYFLLGTAFLVVEVFTLWGWISMRKTELRLYEDGLTYKKFTARWDEITSIQTDVGQRPGAEKITCQITTSNGQTTTLTESIDRVRQAIEIIETEVQHR